MKKSIKFKERVLLYLDLSITLGMILLDLLILMFILAFFDIAINSEDEIGLTITTVIIFITPLIIAFYLISKTLFTILFQKGDMPDIFIVNKKNFPHLYETINDIRIKCKCPKIHVIALENSNRAYITECPRFYFAKWRKRYLVIGVPLLLLLNERELRGVIAHECGHLSKFHSKSTYRIAQKIKNLEKYLNKLKKKGKYKSITMRLITRYLIILDNLYFQLRKNQELEADKVATKVVSNQALINSLIKLTFFDGIFDQSFWAKITDINKNEKKVIEDIYFLMEKAMKGDLKIPDEVYKSFLEQIRNEYSLPGSTHPSISERANSLGATIPTLEGRFNGDLTSIFRSNYESAIRTLFKDEADTILDKMSTTWAETSKERWQKYYTYIDDLKSSLKEINKIEKELDLSQWIKRAFTIEEIEGSDAALKIFKEAEKVDNDHTGIKFNIARILLLKGEEEGVEILNSIMEKDIQLIPNCCMHLVDYYLYNNNRDEAIKYYRYATDFMCTNEEVSHERSGVYDSDEFITHDLSSQTIDKLKTELQKHKEIKKAYIVSKKLSISKGFSLYIIAIKYKKFCSKNKVKFILSEIGEAIHTTEVLPWDTYITSLGRGSVYFEYNLNIIPNSRII